MHPQTRLKMLIDVSREESSERRRQMLREITDIFMEVGPQQDETIHKELSRLINLMATKASEDARAELSKELSTCEFAPYDLILELARDAISVAAPILLYSELISEEDLISLIKTKNQDRIGCIADRKDLNYSVTDAIVEHGANNNIAKILSNQHAKISRRSFETISLKSELSPELRAPLVKNKNTPIDILNDIYFIVDSSLKEVITERFKFVDEDVLAEALDRSNERLKSRMSDHSLIIEAQSFAEEQMKQNQLDGKLLIKKLEDKEEELFCACLAAMAEVEFVPVWRSFKSKSLDGLALICKAADLRTSIFAKIASMHQGANNINSGNQKELDDAFYKLKEAIVLYDEIKVSSAKRAIRFYKVRERIKDNQSIFLGAASAGSESVGDSV